MSRDMTKPTKWLCAQQRQISLASAQSDQSSLSTWRNIGSIATHWAHSEDSDQTGRMPRLGGCPGWVFAGRTLILLLLSCCGSYYSFYNPTQIIIENTSTGKIFLSTRLLSLSLESLNTVVCDLQHDSQCVVSQMCVGGWVGRWCWVASSAGASYYFDTW